nr:MAG TPA: hypothetical protein [Caudoviricetes sp.]
MSLFLSIKHLYFFYKKHWTNRKTHGRLYEFSAMRIQY